MAGEPALAAPTARPATGAARFESDAPPGCVEWLLARALQEEGCPACRVLAALEEQQLATGPPAGCCRDHLDAFIARHDVFSAASAALDAVAAAERDPTALENGAGVNCPVCMERAHTEERVVRSLAERVAGGGAWAAGYRGSDGLCLDHVALAGRVAPREAGPLRADAAARRRRLEQQLRALLACYAPGGGRCGWGAAEAALRRTPDLVARRGRRA
jgi:hypothetical protein